MVSSEGGRGPRMRGEGSLLPEGRGPCLAPLWAETRKRGGSGWRLAVPCMLSLISSLFHAERQLSIRHWGSAGTKRTSPARPGLYRLLPG